MQAAVVVSLVAAVASAAPDTVVVCPQTFRAELDPWVEFRKQQGHTIQIVDTGDTSDAVRRTIHRSAAGGRLRYVLLIGDACDSPEHAEPATGHVRTKRTPGVPTHYVKAEVNVRWSSDPYIATDQPYADVNGDGLPDLAIGRIPVDSPDELSTVVQKILQYERDPLDAPFNNQIRVVAGAGGFGKLIDGTIELAAEQLLTQLVPPEYTIDLTRAPDNGSREHGQVFARQIGRQIANGSLFWVYLGHGQPQRLGTMSTPSGPQSVFSVTDLHDVPVVNSSTPPIAIMLACHTGAFDAASDCLAEEMVVQPSGPIAVLAATRVSMPYGNAVLGRELLGACFAERHDTLGQLILRAQQRTLADQPDDRFRPAFDQLARGLTRPPVNLAAQRREHVQMYHLIGDPLLRVPLADEKVRVATRNDTPAELE